eukprot:g9383.t1
MSGLKVFDSLGVPKTFERSVWTICNFTGDTDFQMTSAQDYEPAATVENYSYQMEHVDDNSDIEVDESMPLIGSDRRFEESAPHIKSVMEEEEEVSGFLVFMFCLGLLVTSLGNSFFFKKMTDAMPNYPFFLSQVTNVVYMPIFYALVQYQIHFTETISPWMRAFPQYKFFIMGAADGLASLLMLFGGVHTSGSMQALLGTAVIPITMLMSRCLLGHRYKCGQVMGSTVIVLGVAVLFSPHILYGSGHNDNVLGFNLLFLLCTIPQAWSSVYKELAFGEGEGMDVNYLQLMVAWSPPHAFHKPCIMPYHQTRKQAGNKPGWCGPGASSSRAGSCHGLW